MSEINIGTINIIFNSNMNSAQEMIPAAKRCEDGPAEAPVKIVTWADGTDEEIVAMVKAADEGLIDLKDYWNVGDVRKVMLSETEGCEWYTSHSRQEAEFVLMNAGEKALLTPTESGRTTCSFVVGLKDCLKEEDKINKEDTNEGGWETSDVRKWCNDGFAQSIPQTLQPIFKNFVNATYANGKVVETTDLFALPAEVEVYGSTEYSAQGEGAQFEFYKNPLNRIKCLGSGGYQAYWWERSPYSSNSTYFCGVYSNGDADFSVASYTYGLAPFGCI
jgi:hypothetical protein